MKSNNKILIVEDDPNFGSILKDYLSLNDYCKINDVIVIPCAADYEKFKSKSDIDKIKKNLKINPNSFIISYNGSITGVYLFDQMLKYFERINFFFKNTYFLVITNNLGLTIGVFTDGDLKRLMQKKRKIENIKIKTYMTKNPYKIDKNTLASEVLSQMNKKKITNVCIYKNDNRKKTIGVLHIHHLLNNLN